MARDSGGPPLGIAADSEAYVGKLRRLRSESAIFRGKFGLTGPKFEGQAKEGHKELTEHWPGPRKMALSGLSRSYFPESLQNRRLCPAAVCREPGPSRPELCRNLPGLRTRNLRKHSLSAPLARTPKNPKNPSPRKALLNFSLQNVIIFL